MPLVVAGLMSHLCWPPPHSPVAMSWDHLPNTLTSLSQGPLLGGGHAKVQGQTNNKVPHCGVLTVYMERVSVFFFFFYCKWTHVHIQAEYNHCAHNLLQRESPKPTFEVFPKCEAPSKWCLCLILLPPALLTGVEEAALEFFLKVNTENGYVSKGAVTGRGPVGAGRSPSVTRSIKSLCVQREETGLAARKVGSRLSACHQAET